MTIVFRSIWIWIATITLIVVWLPLLALIRLFDFDPVRYRTGRWFRLLGVAVAKVNPSWRIHISGERIRDPRRPYVVVSNHQSLADIPLLSHLPWEMKWIAKEDLFDIPIMGWMMRMAGDIPVDRESRRKGVQALHHAGRYLQQKCSVMIFPEGTRSPDGRVRGFTDGAFHLAIRAKVPILPVALEGSYGCLPKHNWKFGEPQEIFMKVFPPIETEGMTSRDVPILREKARRMIIEQVARWRGVEPEEVDALSENVEAPSLRAGNAG